MQTVLIVDAQGDGALLASALRVEGFNVVMTRSTNEARTSLRQDTPVVAVVDLMLRYESGSGLDFAREIRAHHPATRVLLTSAYHLSERQLERADCGVSGFIPKPYDVAEVVGFIRAKASGPPSSRRLGAFGPAESESGIVQRPGDRAPEAPPSPTPAVVRARR